MHTFLGLALASVAVTGLFLVLPSRRDYHGKLKLGPQPKFPDVFGVGWRKLYR